MPVDPVDLVVVGAGPTGLTLALQSAAHGAIVRVIERRPEQFRPSRALIVHPRTLEVLHPLGVVDELLERGERRPAACLHLRSGTVRADLGRFELPGTAYPPLLLIRQADVESVLATALARRGVTVERGVGVVRVASDPDQARVTTEDGREATARFVVGCDGPTSVVRHAMAATWRGGAHRQDVVLADVELDGDLEPGVVHAVPARQGLVFLFAAGEQASWRLLATRPRRAGGPPPERVDTAVATADIDALVASSGLDATVRSVAWSTAVRLQHRLAGTYRAGRLFIAGDAAHTHSPAGGQGMNTGIQDAANLGWKLAYGARARDPDIKTLLDSYEIERRPVARRVIAMTRAIFWGEAATDPAARAVRAVAAGLGPRVLPVLLRRHRVMGAAVGVLGQLNVHYRASPLSVTGGRCPGLPRAGERLPDATVDTEQGTRRLHELTAHAGIHLLAQRDADLSDLGDLTHRVPTDRLRQPGTGLAAIRPDGYVGFSGASSRHDLLRHWVELVHAGEMLRSAPRANGD
jgi:2-polyprenyl-6-methoxyphenol hydroxylase-like FAD-dependent oxidoreductase